MASSTTMPVASTSARSVRMLTEKPTSQIAASVPISATGIVNAGIIVARRSRRKRKITTTTIATASASVLSTSLMEPRMKTASSEVTKISTSSGSVRRNSATASRTPSEIDSVFDVACRTTPRPRPVCPFARRIVSFGAGPSVTRATSRTRTLSRMTRSSKASGVATEAVVRTLIDCRSPVRSPAGAS
jgi:hypothetical protein